MKINIIVILLYAYLSACNGQENTNIKIVPNTIIYPRSSNYPIEINNGIIYFSFDNGKNWKNISSGLPIKTSIGLGGVAVSDDILGVATKEHGIYLYNAKDSNWISLPTSKEIIDSNIGALAFFKNIIFIGTQNKGVFYSKDKGQTWYRQNLGINNQTIRRFVEIGEVFYVCTNDGFYALKENLLSWQLEYGFESLQVNGATYFKEKLYIATNKGIYKEHKNNQWINILPNVSIHNISSDEQELYAMTYNELLISSLDGINWLNIQYGLPENLYTFNVLNQEGTVFAGQWDGVYSRTKQNKIWKLSSNGLSKHFAVTNMKSFKGILIITTSERK